MAPAPAWRAFLDRCLPQHGWLGWLVLVSAALLAQVEVQLADRQWAPDR